MSVPYKDNCLCGETPRLKQSFEALVGRDMAVKIVIGKLYSSNNSVDAL